MTERVLVAGIGNVFLGDDGFGVEVVRRLMAKPRPYGVRIANFGVRGFDLAQALLQAPELTIFVDANSRGGDPGTLYVIEPELESIDAVSPAAHPEARTMHSMDVLRVVRTMGGGFKRVLIVGCEPDRTGKLAPGTIGLSPSVERVVDKAVSLVEALVDVAVFENAPAA